jgi:RimJ/RimL family protein N-acetyltransferase
MTPFLSGEKIYLRGIDKEDAPATVTWFSRPEVRRGTRQYRPKNLHGQIEFLTQMTASPTDILFGIVLKEDDRLIGICGLHHIDPVHHHAELGLLIGDPADWGRGLGGEATRLLVGYGFDSCNLHRIHLTVYEDNPAARRIYERVGFKLEGTLRQHGFREGRWWDIHMMSMLAEEWRGVARI